MVITFERTCVCGSTATIDTLSRRQERDAKAQWDQQHGGHVAVQPEAQAVPVEPMEPVAPERTARRR